MAIGGVLVALPAARIDPGVVPIVLGKLVLHPLATALAFAAMPALGLAVDGELARGGILMAAMPPS